MILTASRSIQAFIWAGIALATLAGSSSAQLITLEIRPRVGDTLSMRMDQLVEMTGMTRGDMSRALAMQTSVFSRAVPQRNLRHGTIVLGYADSVVMSPRVKDGTRTTRRLGGRSTQMLILLDGQVDILQNDSGDADLREFFSQMPAMFPEDPVFVGGKWHREMPVPLRGDVHGTGWVRTTFALDSISRNRDVAFISMKGVLTHERLKDESGERDATGTINGNIQLDRRLGWITDSRMTIVLESIVQNDAAGSRRAVADGMKVRTKIVQRVSAARR